MSNMNTMANVTSDEEALSYLITWLRSRLAQQLKGGGRSLEPYGFDVYRDLLRQRLNLESMDPKDPSIVKEKLPFLNAIWNLCLRGILRPGTVSYQLTNSFHIGNYFALTEYGIQWLQKPGLSDAVPMEYGRFSQLLARYGTKFDDAYRIRADEAVRCYEAHAYFACCAMCGAGAESILLALASSKMGEEEALREYQRSGGRGRIRNRLVGQARSDVQNRFDSYLELLNYWRDESAHGISRSIGEEEAFTSLLLLLRFAQLADVEWGSLTSNS